MLIWKDQSENALDIDEIAEIGHTGNTLLIGALYNRNNVPKGWYLMFNDLLCDRYFSTNRKAKRAAEYIADCFLS